MLKNFQKDFTKDDRKEKSRYERDQVENDPTAETYSDFLQRLKAIAKQWFSEKAGQYAPN